MTSFKRMNYFKSNRFYGILGIFFAITGIPLSIYLTVYYEKLPRLKYEVLSVAPVLDIKEEIGKLDILYDGKSIKKTENTLTIITAKIENDGNASILLNYFDKKVPVGIRVSEGTIIESVEILEASNAYLKENIQIATKGSKMIFSEFILDAGDFFTVKILVLHNKSVTTSIESFGKIATIKEIRVTSLDSERKRKTFLGIPIDILLAIAGLISGFIVATVATLWAVNPVMDSAIKLFFGGYYKVTFKNEPLPIDEFILDSINGSDYKIISELRRSFKQHDFHEFRKKYPEIFDKLIKVEAIRIKGNNIIVPESVARRIDEFYNFLKKAYDHLGDIVK